MQITRGATHPSAKSPADWFTGTVCIDPLFAAEPLSPAADTHATFEPGTRTNSHTHLLGQALIVTFGRGWVQREGAPVEEVGAGGVLRFPPRRTPLVRC